MTLTPGVMSSTLLTLLIQITITYKKCFCHLTLQVIFSVEFVCFTMFYVFSLICKFAGLCKPFITPKTKLTSFSPFNCNTFWSFIIVSCMITSLWQIHFDFYLDIMSNLDVTSFLNNLIVNVIIIVNNITNREKLYRMYEIFEKMLMELKIGKISIKMLTLKLYTWLTITGTMLLIIIIMEIVYDSSPHVMFLRIPVFLSMFHLIVHLCLMLSVLKVINVNLVKILRRNNKNTTIFVDYETSKRSISYIFHHNICFVNIKPAGVVDLKFLCQVYDDLCTSLQLLEKCQGGEVVLTIWLMFTNAVTTVTLISNKETAQTWLEILKGFEIMVWFCAGCFVDEQIRQQVEYTQLLVMKNIIDFKCDEARKEVLQIFNMVVSSNNLQFKACNLYRLNYGTVLGTIVSVITYSIITIQLF